MPISSISSTRSPNRRWLAPLLAAVGLLLLLASISLGAAPLPLPEVVRTLLGQAPDTSTYNIVFFARLPRSLACVLAGTALAVAGLLLQAVLNNSLASPGIIGVNAGAGLTVVLSAFFFPGLLFVRTLAAFAGAFGICLLVYAVARKTGASRITLVLAGVAVSSIFTAAIDTLVTLYPELLMDRASFYIGGFRAVDWDSLLFAGPYVLLGLAAAVLLAGRVNVLILGDEVAASLGLAVERCRFLVILCAAALAAGAVCIAGLLGFVGLIVPHIMRLLAGNDHRRLVWLTALAGADITLFCDILARLLFAPYEIPVGILLSFLGAPFFLYLLLNRQRRRCFD